MRSKGNNVIERKDDKASIPPEPVEFDDLWSPSSNDDSPRGPERILLDRGDVTTQQLEAATVKRHENPGVTVLEALIDAKAISELQALDAIAASFKLPLVRVSSSEVQEDAFSLLPVDYLKAKCVLPLRKENDSLVVGISDPSDIFLIDDLRRRLGQTIRLVVIPHTDILRLIEELTAAPQQQVDEIIKDIAEDAVEVVDEKNEEVTDLERIAGESPVIRYVNFLITSAVREGASDIHIEPGEAKLRVRFRIDGILFDQQTPPMSMHAAVVSRLKIMANMDISERRLPQDGRIRATVRGRNVDLRVSTLPITHGEKCVIRILDNRSILVGLENLGMMPECLNAFNKQITEPHGIILVTGPTGSGKSTTLYSALQVMDGSTMNISTVEDPVEYELAFANQVGVHESIGMTFSAALRSLLRQDPDVIMIGEIRDDETARIAVQASLTGHLVLSTLHTNDAPSSITRLINIGIEPYLISASLNAVLAQRLVRKICEKCKQKVTQPTEAELAYLKTCGMEGAELYQGAGCDVCRNTGYKGRLGIYEFLELDDELRDSISSSPTVTELRQIARSKGMTTLRGDGVQKAIAGLTTLNEVMRATET